LPLEKGDSPNAAAVVNFRDISGSLTGQQVWVAAGAAGGACDGSQTQMLNVYNTATDIEEDTDLNPDNGITPKDLLAETGGPFCGPTSMAVAERVNPLGPPTSVYVTAFDSDKVLVYDARTFTLSPIGGGVIATEAGPRRIAIQTVLE
jgi:hypothetical protein